MPLLGGQNTQVSRGEFDDNLPDRAGAAVRHRRRSGCYTRRAVKVKETLNHGTV
jgi:hypothetical protein